MRTLITLSVQITIVADDGEEYEEARDRMIAGLEADGFYVDITSEDEQ